MTASGMHAAIKSSVWVDGCAGLFSPTYVYVFLTTQRHLLDRCFSLVVSPHSKGPTSEYRACRFYKPDAHGASSDLAGKVQYTLPTRCYCSHGNEYYCCHETEETLLYFPIDIV